MAEYKEYKCESCCYTVTANPKGHDIVIRGEVYCYMCEECREIGDVLTSEKTICPNCGSVKLVKWNPTRAQRFQAPLRPQNIHLINQIPLCAL